MIIDAHNHIGTDKIGLSQSIEELETNMSRYGIDKAIIFPFDEAGRDIFDYSIELLDIKNDKFIQFVRFDPKTVDIERLKGIITRFAGVKLHPRAQNFDPLDKKFYRIYEIIDVAGIPLFMHTRKEHYKFSNPDRMAQLAKDFPTMNIILGHLADASEIAMRSVAKYDNLFLETSIFSLHPLRIGRIAKRVGADKMIFGSDSPFSDQEIELLKVKKAQISEEDKNKILSENIVKLLKNWKSQRS